MKRPQLRDVWRFTRPAGCDGQAGLVGGSSWQHAERWTVAVWEEPTGGYKPVFRVQAALRAIEVPDQWDTRARAWVPAHLERVPCRVPSDPDVESFTTIQAARARARGLALTLSGRMHWTDVRFRAYGADS